MTEQEITDHTLHVRHRVYAIMGKHQDQAFEELDKLHKDGIHDNDVIRALRDGDYKHEADEYIQWAHCIDPDLQDDNTTTNPDGVTDPGTNESDLQMQAAYEKLLTPAFIMEAHPFEHYHDGNGDTEPFIEAYTCGSPDCSIDYDVWIAPKTEFGGYSMDGLEAFLSDERRYAAWEKHAAHLAQCLKDQGAKL